MADVDQPMPPWRRILCVIVGLALCGGALMFFLLLAQGTPRPVLIMLSGATLLGVGCLLLASGVTGR